MKHYWIVTFIIIFGALFISVPESFASENSNSEKLAVHSLIPASNTVEGWLLVEGPDFYSPKTLFEIINGAAPFYINLGFRELGHARFQNQKDETLNITLDIYDQGTVEGGFGVYSSSRHPDESFQKWGTQSYMSGPSIIIWKNRFYISLVGDDERPDTIQALEDYADWFDKKITGENLYPELLENLPQENRIENTELYTAEDYLGYRFLDNTVSAKYNVQSTTMTLFMGNYSNMEKAHSVYSQLTEAIGKQEEFPKSHPIPDHAELFATTNKYLGKMLVVTFDKFVYGVISPEPNAAFDTLYLLIKPIVHKPR